MLINNLPLPALLLELIAQNRWRVPENVGRKSWQNIFKGDIELSEICFWSLEEMQRKTNYLVENLENYKPFFSKGWAGSLANKVYPKTFEPEKTVVIMDLIKSPIVSDNSINPICLDYRISLETPRVIQYPDD
ncbi:MAG: hypothetical protein MUE85_19300, partial [Microscillaceae bacterium]|nr:hypothetical protein [Microscillaceae bacterium]